MCQHASIITVWVAVLWCMNHFSILSYLKTSCKHQWSSINEWLHRCEWASKYVVCWQTLKTGCAHRPWTQGLWCAVRASNPLPIFKGHFGRKRYPFLGIFLEIEAFLSRFSLYWSIRNSKLQWWFSGVIKLSMKDSLASRDPIPCLCSKWFQFNSNCWAWVWVVCGPGGGGGGGYSI